jgi:hypothetical protein
MERLGIARDSEGVGLDEIGGDGDGDGETAAGGVAAGADARSKSTSFARSN